MKKKLLAILLTACATVAGAFGLAGCTNKDSDNSSKWGNEYSFKAAYAQAQELGYTGTLEEFIATISGKDGSDGKDGVDGKDGTDGKDGVDGKDGADGKDGVDGKDGTDGKDGVDGKDGTDGTTPHIGENGNWYIGETDTNVIAEGTNGTDGVGIKNISIDTDGHLIIVLTDDKEIDCGVVLDVHSHEYGEWVTVSEVTCAQIGLKVRVCGTCEYTEAKIIEKVQHTWGGWQGDKENDNHTRICTVCGETESAPHNVVGGFCADCDTVFSLPEMCIPVQGEIITTHDFWFKNSLGISKSHQGIDIRADEGTAVVAVLSGTVESIVLNNLNSYITIAYADGVKTKYQYVDVKTELKEGDTVKQGEIIGTVSVARGEEMGFPAHLHFEIMIDGKSVDPEEYLVFDEE